MKFLSRLFTALNLLPSIATLAFASRPIVRHSATKRAHTSRMVVGAASEFIMVEKKTEVLDYYAFAGWVHEHAGETDLLEGYGHGRAGSNYLFMDWHVETLDRRHADRGLDPWHMPHP